MSGETSEMWVVTIGTARRLLDVLHPGWRKKEADEQYAEIEAAHRALDSALGASLGLVPPAPVVVCRAHGPGVLVVRSVGSGCPLCAVTAVGAGPCASTVEGEA